MSLHFRQKQISSKKNSKIVWVFFVIAMLLFALCYAVFQYQRNNANQASAGVFVFNGQTVDTSTTTGQDNAIVAVDSNNIFIAYNNVSTDDLRFAKTEDGGENWSLSTVDNTDAANELDMDALDEDNIFILYTDNNPFQTLDLILAISTNGGDSWAFETVRTNQDVRNPQIDVLDVNTISIMWWNDNGFFDRRFALSTNGGSSFTEVDPFPSGNGFTIGGPFIVDVNTMFAFGRIGSDYYCSVSTNGGVSFTENLIEAAAPGGSSQEAAMAGVDANTLYFAYNRPLRIAKTTNGCSSFTISTPTVDANTAFLLDGVAVDANNIFFSGANLSTDNLSLVYTNNAGTDWAEVIVDTGSDYGTKNSISAINSNELFFSYHDQTNAQLRFASGTFSMELLSSSVPNNEVGVSRTSAFSYTFDESINTGTVTSSSFFIRGQKSGAIPGVISFSTTTLVNDTVTFTPSSPAQYGEEITITLTDAIQSASGTAFVNGYSSKAFIETEVGTGNFALSESFTSAQTGSGFMFHSCNGDFDNDGDVDIAYGSGTVITILINDGSGSFTASTFPGTNRLYVTCVDVNNDQNVDIAHTNGNSMFISISNGDGTFTAPVTYSSSVSTLTAVDHNDFNNDGYADIIASSQSSVSPTKIAVFFNNGDGTFEPGVSISVGGTTFRSVGSGDFDGDGLMEPLVQDESSFSTPDLRVVDNNGNKTFTNEVSTITLGTASDGRYLMSGDVTGDGRVDAIAIHGGQDISVATFLNNQLVFDTDSQYPVFTEGTCNEGDLIDVDGDDDLDIFGTCQSPTVFSVAENNGSGVFTLLTDISHSIGTTVQAVTSADFNGDGIMDAAIGGANGSVEIYFQVAPYNVTSISPSQNAINVSVSSDISLVFSNSLNTATVNQTNLRVFGSGALVNGAYTFSTTTNANDTVTFNPTNDFELGERIEVVVTANVQSSTSAPAAPFVSTFDVQGGNGTGQMTFVEDLTADLPVFNQSGDVDNDGDMDIISIGGGSPGALEVFKNNGNGTFAAPTTTSMSNNPRSLVLADFNADGFIDVANNYLNTSAFSVSVNNGSGVFPVRTDFVTSGGGTGIDAADFDGDGDKDLVIVTGASSLTTFLNNGSASFTSDQTLSIASSARHVATGDFDEDGDMDIVASRNGNITVYLNNGDATFALGVNYSVSGTGFYIQTGDITADGNLDIVIGDLTNDFISVFPGNGDGTFAARQDYSTNSPEGMVLVDLTGNGLFDVVSVDNGNSEVDILQNTGGGTLTVIDTDNTGNNPSGVSAADFNNDGVMDIAVSGTNDNELNIFFGEEPLLVSSTVPAKNAINISVDSDITIVFNKSLDTGTVNTTNLPVFASNQVIAGAYSFTTTTLPNDTVTFNPTSDFKAGEKVLISVTANVLSSTATPATPYVGTFTSAATGGNFNPVILSAVSVTGSTPEKLFHADLDGDGDIDIAVATNTTTAIFLNDGAGVLTESSTINNNGTHISGGDYDGDGTIDLALSNSTNNSVEFYSNNGSAVFSSLSSVSVGETPRGIVTSDYDGDGDLDIAVGDITDTDIHIALNNGAGSFTNVQTVGFTSRFWDGTSGDFDLDGDIDIAFASDAGTSVVILTNNGSATFTLSSISTSINNQNIDAGDIDGDGDLDLYTGGSSSGRILVNNPPGTFTLGNTLFGGAGQHRDMLFGDLDGDGDLDLPITRLANGTTLFSNNGAGIFAFETTLSDAVFNGDGLITADMDGDGDLDIVQANRTPGTVSVFLGGDPASQEEGGGGAFTQISQQAEQGSNTPIAPTPIQGEALDATSIRWEFTDNSGIETGFQLVNDSLEVLAEVDIANQVAITESGLQPNTLYEGRSIIAKGAVQNSEPSLLFEPVATRMPAVSPLIETARPTSITVIADQEVPNLTEGESALYYELVISTAATAASPIVSGWVQESSYTFEGVEPGQEYQVRINARNQDGIETGFSAYTDPRIVPQEDEVVFDVSIGATYVNGEVFTGETLDPNRNIEVTVRLRNAGSISGTNVLLNMPIPAFMEFIPGSLFVDANFQSSDADQDFGQGNQNAVSVIWPEVIAGGEATITFQLGFDLEALREEKARETATANALNELSGLGDVLSAANPQIFLEVSVNSSEIPDAFTSASILLEPNLQLVSDEVAEPLPPVEIEEPAPTPTPAPPTPIQPGGPNAFSPNGSDTPVGTNQPQQDANEEEENKDEEEADSLILTSEADNTEESLVFMGTTSEPNSIIIVTIVSQSFEVMSDENGVWELFVSPEDLGLSPGDVTTIEVESVALKDDKSSNIVRQELVLSRAEEGQLLLEDEASVQSTQIVTTIARAAEFIEEQEEEVQAALAVAAPVAVIVSAPLLGYLPFIPTLLFHGLTSLFGIAGRKKKERRYYGIAYDTVSKEPLSLAIIRIYNYDSNKLIATQVTDKKGRYDLLVPKGKYRLSVTRPGFSFPTTIVSGQTDGLYQQLYDVQQPLLIEDEFITPDIPLDPVHYKREWNLAGFMKKIGLVLQKTFKWLVAPLLLVGTIISGYLVISDPTAIVNWIYVALYMLLLLLQLRLRPSIQKAWGVVYDTATGAVLPLTTVQLIDAEYNRVVKSRLSDYEGRYSFLTHSGSYILKATKPGFERVDHSAPQDPYHHPIPEEVEITDDNQHLTGDIAMKPLED